MSPTLTLRVPSLPDPLAPDSVADLSCEYCLDDDNWHSASLQQLPTLLGRESLGALQVGVVIPGICALSSVVHVPRKQHKHLARILPYLCEESVTGDLEDLHFATGDINAEQVSLCAVDRRSLRHLLQSLQEIGVTPTHLTTERELLRAIVPVDTSLLWLDPSTCHLIANQQAITLDGSQRDYLLQQLQRQPPAALLLLRPTDLDDATLSLTLEELQAHDTRVDSRVLPENCSNLTQQLQRLELWSGAQSRAINLLQGEFAPPRSHHHGLHWRPFALAAGVLLALNLAYLLGSGVYFQNRSQTLYSASEDLYRSYFPDDKRIINIRTQVRNHLRQPGDASTSEFLQALQAFVAPWQVARNQLTLKSLRYSQSRSELVLDIEGRSIEQLDKLQVSLGDRAELLSANEDSSGVRGRIKLSGGNP